MKINIALVALFSFFFIVKIQAQELNCRVTINTEQVNVNELRNSPIFERLQGVMTEFMNNRRWTADQYGPEERINCTLTLIITRATAQGNFEATANFSVIRPVFGTSYETVLLRVIDRKFDFNYLPDNPLNYNDNTYTDNLTSLMAFYSYLALTLDYDSFSKLGGSPHLQKAFTVLSLAQNYGGGAWIQGTDIRSRAWLLENLNNPQFLTMREAMYTYHRQVLDELSSKPAEGRKKILEILNSIKQINAVRPSSAWILTFFDTKADELTNVFMGGTADEKKQAFQLLSELDPTKTDTYRKLSRP
jgi:hypothetical protein